MTDALQIVRPPRPGVILPPEPEWSTALPDWKERLLTGRSLMPVGPLFECSNEMEFFRSLRLVDVTGQPLIGEAALPWTLDWAEAFFGSLDPVSGRRLIRNFFLLISKKNGKSTIAAAIMLTCLYHGLRSSAEYLILAPTIEAANNAFFPARDMVRADPDLAHIMKIAEHTRTITNLDNNAQLKIVAADSETISGKKAVGVLIDELWLFGTRSNAAAMIMEAAGGLASNPEGFVMYLTTQSDRAPAGVFLELLTRFRAIRDGTLVDKRSLGVLYELPPEMMADGSYRDPANFWLTNPNIDRSVDEQYLRERYAENEGHEHNFRVFLAKHLNVQIDIALRNDSWAGATFWERGADPTITLEALIERCEVLVVGIDGGGLDDLLGVCVAGREKATKRWLNWFHAYISPEGWARRRNNQTAYQQFIDEGSLTLVDSLPDDLEAVVEIVKRIKTAGLLGSPGVGCDKLGLPQIVDALARIDVTEQIGTYVNVRQGIGLAPSFKAGERKLADGTLAHDGSAMMRWCVGNAKMTVTPTATRIAREDSGQGKIDPLVAGFNAWALLALNPQATGNFQMMIFGRRH